MRYREFSPVDGLDGADAGRPLSLSFSSFEEECPIDTGVALVPSLTLLREAGMAVNFEPCDETLSDSDELEDPPRRRLLAGELVPTETPSRVTWILRTSVCGAW